MTYLIEGKFDDKREVRKPAMNLYWRQKLWERRGKIELWILEEVIWNTGETVLSWDNAPFF